MKSTKFFKHFLVILGLSLGVNAAWADGYTVTETTTSNILQVTATAETALSTSDLTQSMSLATIVLGVGNEGNPWMIKNENHAKYNFQANTMTVTKTDNIPSAGQFIKITPSANGYVTLNGFYQSGHYFYLLDSSGNTLFTYRNTSGSVYQILFNYELSSSNTYYLYGGSNDMYVNKLTFRTTALQELLDEITAATTLKSTEGYTAGVDDFTSAITTAQSVANNATATNDDMTTAKATLITAEETFCATNGNDTYTVTSTSDLNDGKTVRSVYGITITYHGSWSYSTERISSGAAKTSTTSNSSLTNNIPTSGDYIEIFPSVTGSLDIDAYFFKGNVSRLVNATTGHIVWAYSSGSNGESVQSVGSLIAGNTYRLYKYDGNSNYHLKSITFTPGDNQTISYTISDNENIGKGSMVSDIAGIDLTFGISTEAVWTKSSYSGWGLDTNCSATLTDGAPTAGTFVKVEPSTSGRLTVQWYHRSNGKGKLNLTDGTNKETIAGGDTGTQTSTFSTILNTSKTYYLYISDYVAPSSVKIGFVGFTYTTETAITAVDNLGYTFSSTLPLDFTGKTVEAYTAAYNSTNKNVELTRVYKVPANTGLFIKGSADDIPVLSGDADAIGTNNLVAVSTSQTVNATTTIDETEYTNFVLGLADKNDESKGVVFVKAKSTGTIVGAGKAYLQIPTASISSARMDITFVDSETTGISTAEILDGNKGKTSQEVFNLNGQRVVNPGKGLYIINGKKVLK